MVLDSNQFTQQRRDPMLSQPKGWRTSTRCRAVGHFPDAGVRCSFWLFCRNQIAYLVARKDNSDGSLVTRPVTLGDLYFSVDNGLLWSIFADFIEYGRGCQSKRLQRRSRSVFDHDCNTNDHKLEIVNSLGSGSGSGSGNDSENCGERF